MFNLTIYLINFAILILLINTIFYYHLYYFQLKAYFKKRFFKYYINSKLFLINFILFIVLFLLLNIFYLFKYKTILNLTIFLIFFIFLFIFYFKEIKKNKKIKFKTTFRIKRLIFLLNIFILTIYILSCVYFKNFIFITNTTIFFVPEILIVLDCFDIYKYIQNLRCLILAKKLIKNIAIKIGITGSNGKTTVKNILSKFLENDYKTVSTLKNYNTPKGVISSILATKNINPECYIFEMGARQKKDISSLCKLTQINLGAVTNVAPQHLESFKTLDNVYQTKKELSDFLLNNFCSFNYNNIYTKKMYYQKQGEKFLFAILDYKNILKTKKKIKLKKCVFCKNLSIKTNLKIELIAFNIKFKNGFNTFQIKHKNKIYKAKTKLLGKHNISNILCAMSIALKLGLKIKSLINKTVLLEPTEHRLQLIKTHINIIDDSYNCSIESARTAIDVLTEFKGKKMVCTPGIIEGGNFQYDLNKQLSCMLNKIADFVIVVGKTNKKCFEENLAIKNVFYADSLEQAKSYFKLLKTGDNLLILNDLPDDYQ